MIVSYPIKWNVRRNAQKVVEDIVEMFGGYHCILCGISITKGIHEMPPVGYCSDRCGRKARGQDFP